MRPNLLEHRINQRLKAMNPAYEIRGLRRLPNGEFWFDLGMTFNPRDMEKVNRIFKEMLGRRQLRRHEAVQAKFYLPEDLYRRLRQKAAHDGVTQSALVEKALEKVLA